MRAEAVKSRADLVPDFAVHGTLLRSMWPSSFGADSHGSPVAAKRL
jgi:hypothetical protein